MRRSKVLIENILAFREFEDINNRAEVGEIVPFENLQELSAWIGTNTSQIYSVYAYPRAALSEAQQLALEGGTPEHMDVATSRGALRRRAVVRAT